MKTKAFLGCSKTGPSLSFGYVDLLSLKAECVFLIDCMPGPLKNPFPIETRYSPFSILLRHRTLWQKVEDAFQVFNGDAGFTMFRLEDLLVPEERLGIFDYLCAGILVRRFLHFVNFRSGVLSYPLAGIAMILIVCRPLLSALLTLLAFPFILLVHGISLPFSTPLHQTVFNQTDAPYKSISDSLRNGRALEVFIPPNQVPIMAIPRPDVFSSSERTYPHLRQVRLSEPATHPTHTQRLYVAMQQKKIIDCAFMFYCVTPHSREKEILMAALKLNLSNITARLEAAGELQPLLETLQYQSGFRSSYFCA